VKRRMAVFLRNANSQEKKTPQKPSQRRAGKEGIEVCRRSREGRGRNKNSFSGCARGNSHEEKREGLVKGNLPSTFIMQKGKKSFERGFHAEKRKSLTEKREG